MPPLAAQRLQAALGPDFRLLRPIGEGAVSRVYLASETALERLVAVKVMREELAGDQEALRRFAREARAAARIVHPNVVVIHRVGVLPEDELPFLLMEYVEGRTLEDVLVADGPMEVNAARETLAGIASALAAAHEKRIVHRDVRPGNIMIERGTGRPVLTDFGIAAVMESGSEIATQLTRAGQVLGDPRYLSPERLLGEPPTEAADVFSLGVVGYELLTGHGPFTAITQREIVDAHLNIPAPDLLARHPDLDPGLARLLQRCLAKKAVHRPQAAEVVRSLAGTAESSAAPDHHDPLFPALSLFLQELRRRQVYRVGAAYAAAIFILLQLAALVLPALGAPAWLLTALVIACLAGLPVALVLGWVFDVTAEGIRRTAGEPRAALSASFLYRAMPAAGLLVSVALASFLAWRLIR